MRQRYVRETHTQRQTQNTKFKNREASRLRQRETRTENQLGPSDLPVATSSLPHTNTPNATSDSLKTPEPPPEACFFLAQLCGCSSLGVSQRGVSRPGQEVRRMLGARRHQDAETRASLGKRRKPVLTTLKQPQSPDHLPW